MSYKKILLTIFIIVAYVFLSHAALASELANSIWRKLALFLLLSSMAALVCWGSAALLSYARIGSTARYIWIVLIGIAAIGIDYVYWSVLLLRLDWIYVCEHVVTNGVMCWFFGHTLFGGRTPIITTLARTIHPTLPEKVLNYTRRVTIAWTLFFALQIVVSLLIFNFSSINAWSIFANILNWPLIGLMFVIEYFFRKRVDPDFPHPTIKQSIEAYLKNNRKSPKDCRRLMQNRRNET